MKSTLTVVASVAGIVVAVAACRSPGGTSSSYAAPQSEAADALDVAPASETAAASGGDVVVCQEPAGESAELLDYHLARRDGVAIAKDDERPIRQIVLDTIATLDRHSPIRAARYREWLDELDQVASFRDDIDLIEGGDAADIDVTSRCAVKKAVHYREPRSNLEFRYVVDTKLMESLPRIDAAGLMLHMLIMREVSEYEHPGAAAVRDLNAALASGALRDATWEGFVESLVAWRISRFEANGYEFDAYQRKDFCGDWEQERAYDFEKRTDVTFHPNGRLASGLLACGTIELLGLKIPVGGRYMLAEFHPNGRFRKLPMPSRGFYGEKRLRLPMNGDEVMVSDWLELDEEGRLVEAPIVAPVSIRMRDGTRLKCRLNTATSKDVVRVRFDHERFPVTWETTVHPCRISISG